MFRFLPHAGNKEIYKGEIEENEKGDSRWELNTWFVKPVPCQLSYDKQTTTSPHNPLAMCTAQVVPEG